MGDISNNFSRKEFKCSCGCGLDTVDYTLLTTLERLRMYIQRVLKVDVYIKITGGNRCEEKNREVGGAILSEHINCKAADIQVISRKTGKLIKAKDIFKILDDWYPNTFGLGLYVNRVHIDVRVKRARWDKTKTFDQP